ncbi:MAG: MFS transporter, partial [Chloroflexota bacterium]
MTEAPSYRRLFAVEGMPRLVASMLIARTASQMVALVLVLFALDRYGSAAIAGTVTFLSIAPGLVVSPIAGALLDRYGRTRLVIADYVVAAAALGLIALLAALDRLPVPALLAIVTVASLTFPLSTVGIRTLFPLIVPRPLWERANAIDSNGYVLSSVVGPALAGTLVATLGGELALATTAAIFGLAAVVTIGLRD